MQCSFFILIPKYSAQRSFGYRKQKTSPVSPHEGKPMSQDRCQSLPPSFFPSICVSFYLSTRFSSQQTSILLCHALGFCPSVTSSCPVEFYFGSRPQGESQPLWHWHAPSHMFPYLCTCRLLEPTIVLTFQQPQHSFHSPHISPVRKRGGVGNRLRLKLGDFSKNTQLDAWSLGRGQVLNLGIFPIMSSKIHFKAEIFLICPESFW